MASGLCVGTLTQGTISGIERPCFWLRAVQRNMSCTGIPSKRILTLPAPKTGLSRMFLASSGHTVKIPLKKKKVDNKRCVINTKIELEKMHIVR